MSTNVNINESFEPTQKIFNHIEGNRKRKGGNILYINVSDTGKGIFLKMMPNLFEKFTTDPDFRTGHGLFPKKLVEAHGGRIWSFNNQDGIGSTFVFSLPK